jgi:hypothetical protein
MKPMAGEAAAGMSGGGNSFTSCFAGQIMI